MANLAFLVIEETVNNNLTYIGRAKFQSDVTSDPVWQITRIVKAGGSKYTQTQGEGQFAYIWDDRASLTWPAIVPSYTNRYSLNFDGINDYAISSESTVYAGFTRTLPWSLSLWFKLPVGGTGTLRYLLSRAGTGASEIGFQFRVTATDVLQFCLHTNLSLLNYLQVNGSTTITTGVWHHAVVTYDGSSAAAGVVLYLDGVAETPTVVQDTLTSGTATSNVGLSVARYDAVYTEGNFDEVSTFSAELSGAQALALYNAGLPDDLTGHVDLLSWYRMGDGDNDQFPVIFDEVTANGDYLVMTSMTATDLDFEVPS